MINFRRVLPSEPRDRTPATLHVHRFDRRFERRFADVVIAGALLIITSPLMLLVALVLKSEGSGPILDRKLCIARGGRRFQMLKFRTMVSDPENAMPVWACKTTQVGEFLQSCRIDCLPQLVNVLRGEMSIVDPDRNSPTFLD